MDAIRNGNFTSSKIVALTSFGRDQKSPGAPYKTYIQQKNWERKLKRSLNKEISTPATNWGKLCETRVHELLGVDYKYCSQETLSHPTVDCWKGSPDHLHIHTESHLDAVCDVKCPSTLESFCALVDGWKENGIQGIRDNHKEGETYYWQLVSNACITGMKYAELIVYCPFKDELDAIRIMCKEDPRFYKIWGSQDEELPFLIEGGQYTNLNVFRFIVPPEDKMFLHSRVEMAAKELLPVQTLIPA